MGRFAEPILYALTNMGSTPNRGASPRNPGLKTWPGRNRLSRLFIRIFYAVLIGIEQPLEVIREQHHHVIIVLVVSKLRKPALAPLEGLRKHFSNVLGRCFGKLVNIDLDAARTIFLERSRRTPSTQDASLILCQRKTS
jgi:hypothetical protein